jgi:hypothetical protein
VVTRHALSPAQEAIWFEDQVRRGVGNTGSFSVTLTGELGEGLIEAACAAVVRRHAPLRALVRVVGDRPFLETDLDAAERALPYEAVEVPCRPGEELAATRAWRDGRGTWCFDLTREPTLAFRLLRHGPGRRTLLMVGHHLSLDGRSKFVFARDFATALTALRSGAAPPSDPLPWPAWPAAGDELVERAVRYWRDADVAGFGRLRLPGGEAAGPAVGTTGEWSVDGARRARLADLAHAHGTTLFGGLLAAVAVTLYGYGNRRMVLCAPVDVTTQATRDLIGLGVNIVPFVVELGGEDTFVSALAVARDARARLREFQLVPLRALGAVTAGCRPLFSRVSVSYQRIATDVPDIPGLRSSWDFVAPNSAETFDLMMHLRDAHDRLVLRLDHSGGDLDTAAASAIGRHLGSVLSLVLDRPHTPLRSLPLLPPESVAAGPTSSGRAGHSTAELCAAVAARHPDRPAVTGPGGSIAYRELARAARGPGLVAVLARVLGGSDGDGWTAPAAGSAWLAGHLGGGVGPGRTVQLAEPGSAWFWHECWLAWAGGGTLCRPGGPVSPEVLREHGITTLLAPYQVLRRLVGTPSPTLRDVLTPMAELRPSAEITGLVGAGVRLHAVHSVAGTGPVAVQECTPAVLAAGYEPVLRHIAPGVLVSVRCPDGRVLPHGVTGRITVEVRTGPAAVDPADPAGSGPARRVVPTGDLGWVGRDGAVRLHGADADIVEWAGQSLTIPALERHLAAHPDVEDAAVVCSGHRPLAYLVPRAGSGLDVRAARRHTRRRSVPGEPRPQVRVVAELPRTPDGRVDRSALSGGPAVGEPPTAVCP